VQDVRTATAPSFGIGFAESHARPFFFFNSRQIMNKALGSAVCTALVALVLCTTPARAEGNETVTRSAPNSALLHSGIVALGVPYAASVLVGVTSDHEGDKNLYLPVAGPWLDLGHRGGCGEGYATPCDRETAYKALLVVDGVVQAIGALEIVGAFVYPETHTSTASVGPTWSVRPAQLAAGGYGLSAFGSF
jgi:hypothetical protein